MEAVLTKKKRLVDGQEVSEEQYQEMTKNPQFRLKILNESTDVVEYKKLTKLEE